MKHEEPKSKILKHKRPKRKQTQNLRAECIHISRIATVQVLGNNKHFRNEVHFIYRYSGNLFYW